ncbi:MAG: hypothetical protein HQL13_08815, partial [Candidatus Omnitrophica bacterium]|nr:hypothetical protein [Candidatus Omnitrophota bacterium]
FSEIEDEYGIGAAAAENVFYNLGISGTILARGITNKEGRFFQQFLDMVLYLREMVLTTSGEITAGMKVQAAEFLNVFLTNHMLFGKSREAIDLNGGLSVPKHVHELNLGQKKLDQMRQAEQEAFVTFMENVQAGNLKGHSLTIMEWLGNFYSQFSKYYYQQEGKENLEKDMGQHRPQLARITKELEAQGSWENMMAYYKSHFKKVDTGFKPEGLYSGVVASLPVRVEDSAGGIGDSTFLSTYRSEFYRILNHAALLSREDGTVGRSVELTFEICDRKDLPKSRDALGNPLNGETFLAVKSLDVGFEVLVGNSNDAAKKSKADLVLQTLVSLGLFPQALLDKAKQEGKEVETAREVFDHVFGPGRGLKITMNVKGISAGSGLAISSILAMGSATAFDVILGEKPKHTPTKSVVNRISIPDVPDGYYYVQVSRNRNMDILGTPVYQFPTRSLNNKLALDLILDEMPTGRGQYYLRYRKIAEDAAPQEGSWFAQEGAWTYKGGFGVRPPDNGTVETEEIGEGLIEIQRYWREYAMMDDRENTAAAIVASQTGVLRRAEKAGTQDELSGLGGMVLSFAGEDSMVPDMVRVPMSPESIREMNRALKIIRIGMSEPAEDTLDQVFMNTMLNETREVQNIWGQCTLEMTMALQRGDLLAAGDWAYRMVALRQKVAPVSINPQVLNVLEDFVRRYGLSHHFRYGITGARSTGSNLIFFDPRSTEGDIHRIMQELENALMQARQKAGKIGVYEEP